MRGDFAIRPTSLALCLVLVISMMPSQSAAQAGDVVPPVSDIVVEDFERGTLDGWGEVSPDDLRLVPGSGHNGSTGLSVTVSQHYSFLRQTGVARAEEGYLSFWLDPNSVSIPDQGTSWIPGRSICVATVRGAQWHALVALYVRRPSGQGYKAYLVWDADDGTQYDLGAGEFDLANGWQKITLGFRVDDWVAVWLNDVSVRQVTGVAHDEAWGEIIEIGKSNTNSSIAPSGALNYDDVAFQIPRIDNLWVDAIGGDDGYDGLTTGTAFRTIQRAASLAGPGTVVHIMPGIYREMVSPVMNGSAAEPSYYIAENGPDTTVIRGSGPSQALTWTRLAADPVGLPPSVDPTNLYYADLSAWGLDGPPRFVVQLDDDGNVVARLPLAREPDWQVTTEWKYAEFWWAADGGSSPAACNPATNPDHNCDLPQRSTTQLTDRTDDTEPAGIEAGNLTTLGDLTGATLVALDTDRGHYVYHRTITAHDVAAGRITVDKPCLFVNSSSSPGLGWGSKYFVEGMPYLLDSPGEWWYDKDSGRLYLWPPTAGDPATMSIELSQRENGFRLGSRSYITLDGLTLEFFEGSAVYQSTSGGSSGSYHNTVRNATVRYANVGIDLYQTVDGSASNITDGFALENSEVSHMDSLAIRLNYWWPGDSADSFTHAGIVNTVIRNNELYELGFHSDLDSALGALFNYADRLRFEGNHVHHVAQTGTAFSRSVVQSPKEWGFSPEEIKTGEILVKDNVFEKACLLSTDCGALGVWGSAPDNHVFRDMLITGNVFRNTFGWTYISEKRGRASGGTSSDVQGMEGYGLFVDSASGIHAYRNIAYNNAYAGLYLYSLWWDGDIVYYNNVASNSLYGINLDGVATRASINTQVANNIVVNNEGYGILIHHLDGDYGNFLVDHNLYYRNGWRAYEDGGMWQPGAMAVYRGPDPHEYYQTLAAIQANTPWEDHGMEFDPGFLHYDVGDHDLFDGFWPDFHATPASSGVLDRGTTSLPGSLARLLLLFGVPDLRLGNAFDIGRYEAAGVIASPATQGIQPGGITGFVLSSYPPSFPAPLTLTASCPDPHLLCSLASAVLDPGQAVTLTVADTHDPGTPIGWPAWYTITVSAAYGGGTQNTYVRLLVGGERVNLPCIQR